MSEGAGEDIQTVILEDTSDYLNELSEYLEVLSNSQRLKILKILEKAPRDVRKIASEIDTSYENTKKHLDKLLSVGLIRKEAGLGQPTSKGIHPVWKYSLVPGAMEAIVRNLGMFSNMRIPLSHPDLKKRIEAVRGQVTSELQMAAPYVMVLGGSDDGKVFPLTGVQVLIGRVDSDSGEKIDAGRDVILAAEYTAVTRISKPHARFVMEKGIWSVADAGSTGGTYLNANLLQKSQIAPIRDGDLIDLARGQSGARLLVLLPEGG